jgi:hypothetical protein
MIITSSVQQDFKGQKTAYSCIKREMPETQRPQGFADFLGILINAKNKIKQ